MINMAQTTLARPVSYHGIGLHAGEEVHMTLCPAPSDTGIVFVRIDMKGKPSVPAQLSYVTNTMKATTLEQGEAKVFTVEHLLSALYGMRVDNCIVELDSAEPPVADGSSLTFVRLIQEAGIVSLEAKRNVYAVKRQHIIEDNDKFIAIIPSDVLRITFTSINPRLVTSIQFIDTLVNPETYVKNVAPARTIAFTEELAMLRSMGLGKGGTIENVVVYDQGKCLSQLRFDDELVRHKALDVIGDISLIGCPVRGHIIAVKSSHTLNNRLAQEIWKEIG